MTNKEVLKSLNQIKTFCSAEQSKTVEYVIEVFEYLEKSGVNDPLSADFTRVENSK